MNRDAVNVVEAATVLLMWELQVQRGTFLRRAEAADIIVPSTVSC